jgi:hypothetical protein
MEINLSTYKRIKIIEQNLKISEGLNPEIKNHLYFRDVNKLFNFF